MHLSSTRFGSHAHFQTALTLEGVRAVAPSAFATHPHESRSDRYSYIPTSEVIEGLTKQGFQPFSAVQSTSRIEGKGDFTKHLIRFRHPDASLAANGTDSLPEVVLINSHDGTSAYKLFAGIFRLVCTNGLIIADSTTGSISVPHKGNVIDRVIEGSLEIIGQSRKALDVVKSWGQLQLTSGEQLAFAKSAHHVRFSDHEGNVTTPIQPEQLLTPRRHEDTGSDLWQTFNRVQENLIRGGLRARGPRTIDGYRGRISRTRPIRGIDQDVKLNRALWSLGSYLAEQKAA